MRSSITRQRMNSDVAPSPAGSPSPSNVPLLTFSTSSDNNFYPGNYTHEETSQPDSAMDKEARQDPLMLMSRSLLSSNKQYQALERASMVQELPPQSSTGEIGGNNSASGFYAPPDLYSGIGNSTHTKNFDARNMQNYIQVPSRGTDSEAYGDQKNLNSSSSDASKGTNGEQKQREESSSVHSKDDDDSSTPSTGNETKESGGNYPNPPQYPYAQYPGPYPYYYPYPPPPHPSAPGASPQGYASWPYPPAPHPHIYPPYYPPPYPHPLPSQPSQDKKDEEQESKEDDDKLEAKQEVSLPPPPPKSERAFFPPSSPRKLQGPPSNSQLSEEGPKTDKTLEKRARKNARSRRRAAELKQFIAVIKKKRAEDRTPEEIQMFNAHEEKRLQKNQRTKERALERKIRFEEICAKPVEERTLEEKNFLEETKNAKFRKNEVDRLRKKRQRKEIRETRKRLCNEDISAGSISSSALHPTLPFQSTFQPTFQHAVVPPLQTYGMQPPQSVEEHDTVVAHHTSVAYPSSALSVQPSGTEQQGNNGNYACLSPIRVEDATIFENPSDSNGNRIQQV